jgi:hypothetical protein
VFEAAVMNARGDNDRLKDLRERFDRAGLRLLVSKVNDEPETWHAIVISTAEQRGGTTTPFAGQTELAAAESALAHYRDIGRIP